MSDGAVEEVWRVKAWWKPVADEPVDEATGLVTTETTHADAEEARTSALRLSQLRGVLGVVRYNADGDVVGHYDRFSNVATRPLWNRDDATPLLAERMPDPYAHATLQVQALVGTARKALANGSNVSDIVVSIVAGRQTSQATADDTAVLTGVAVYLLARQDWTITTEAT